MRPLVSSALVLALAGCGDLPDSSQHVTAGVDGEADAVIAIVSHLRASGRVPADGWFVLDRLVFGDVGPLLIDSRSFEARRSELADSLTAGLRRHRLRACRVQGGSVCAEAMHEPAATIVSIGPAEAHEAPDCVSPWWIGIVYLDSMSDVPEEGYASVLLLSCLERTASGAWHVTELVLRGAEN